jgi:hypothetical protein
MKSVYPEELLEPAAFAVLRVIIGLYGGTEVL